MIKIAVDGSHSPKTKDGGWAFVTGNYDGVYYIEYGWEPDTTNNRMELLAAIKALEWVVKTEDYSVEVEVTTDSAYVSKCFHMNWPKKWHSNGWLNGAGDPVANRDLWERLIALNSALRVTWKHIKGHAGLHSGNELADSLAVQARGGRLHGTT